MVPAKTIAIVQFIVKQIAKGKRYTAHAIVKRARQAGADPKMFSALILEELRFHGIKPPRGLLKEPSKSYSDYQKKWAKDKGFKSYSDYQDKLAKDKGFKSYYDYREKLAKNRGYKSHSDYRKKLAKDKFVSQFAALLEAGVPVEEAAKLTLPLVRKPFFPKRKLGFIADEAVAAAKRKKLPAHIGR